MKASTALIIGAGALAIVFIWSRSSSSSLLGAPKPASSTGSNTLLAVGGGILGGLGLSALFSPGASSGSSTNTTTSGGYSQAGLDYLTDQTAASDTESGVVGFGGWD